MRWTKRHSQNAVAAKARKRMAQPEIRREVQARIRVRRSRAKWMIQIRDLEHGDTLTIRLYRLPWPARYASSEGKEYSAAALGKIVRQMLTSAP
jgi:ribosomal protein L18